VIAEHSFVIRPATTGDCEAVARIYNHYILDTAVTFEEQAVSSNEIAGRIDKVLSASLPYLVALRDDQVVGYSYAGKWHERSAYRFAVETTIYLDPAHVGKGLGNALYRALLGRLEEKDLHVAIGGIALPNPASVALHERLGFKKVAHYAQVGFKFDGWIDVGYWQRMI
jgi:phosphinothricin acetyltransferase